MNSRPRFVNAGRFSEGMAVVNCPWWSIDPNIIPSYLSKENKKIIEIEKPGLGRKVHPGLCFSEGLAAVSVGYDEDKWGENFIELGYIDKSGEYYSDGSDKLERALNDYHVMLNEGGYYDVESDECILKAAVRLNMDGNCIVYSDFGHDMYRDGYVDKSGRFVIKPQFKDARPFSEGLAVVNFNQYINKNGNLLFKIKGGFGADFHEGLAVARIFGKEGNKDKYGFIDKKGEFAIEPKFDSATDFSEGLALVHMGEEIYAIDKAGEFVFKCDFKKSDILQINKYSEGLALVCFADQPVK